MSDFWIYLLVLLVSMLAIGSAVVTARYRRDIQAARGRVDGLGSQVIETACGPIEYTCRGDGPAVLVVHGAMGGFDQGLWLAQSFDITHFQVISVSRFGYLRSPVPADANLDRQADAFACLLDALEIRQAAVFAVSAGSTSAIRFAARHPGRVAGLILLSPDAPGSVQMALPPRFVFDRLLRSDFVYWAMVTFFGKWVQNAIGLAPRGYALSPENAARIRMIQRGDLPVSPRMDGMIFESFTTLAEYNASVSAASPYPLAQIETPALVINALDDPIAIPENVRGLAEQLPGARLLAVPDGGHFLFGHTEEVKQEIWRFLRSHVAGPKKLINHEPHEPREQRRKNKQNGTRINSQCRSA
jgi:pimeloyl-ACP methyl ester carboxylesterase